MKIKNHYFGKHKHKKSWAHNRHRNIALLRSNIGTTLNRPISKYAPKKPVFFVSPPKKQASKGGKKEVRMLKASKNQEDTRRQKRRISFLITLLFGSEKFVSCQFSSLGVLS